MTYAPAVAAGARIPRDQSGFLFRCSPCCWSARRWRLPKRKFTDIRPAKEHVAEFRYRPGKCDRDYRIVVVWKDLEVHKGQRKPFDDARCFFSITNDFRKSAEAIVFEANHRCNQENLFA